LRPQANAAAWEFISLMSASSAFALIVIQFFLNSTTIKDAITLMVFLPCLPSYFLVVNASEALDAVRDMMNVNDKEGVRRDTLHKYYIENTRRRYLGLSLPLFFSACGSWLILARIFHAF
jgi:hypothetical protein